MKQEKYQRSKWRVLAASALSSMISTTITNPIEVAKLNLQYFPLFCPHYPHKNYRHLITCSCSKLSIAGSIKSLKMAIPQVMFSSIIFMQLYQQIRQFLINRWEMTSIHSTLLASFAARLAVTSVNIPFETIRIKLSNQLNNYRGFKIMLLRDMTYSLLFWSGIQTYRNKMTNGEYRGEKIKLSIFNWKGFYVNMLPGFIIGGFISALTTPLDTLKTRVQSQGITKYSIIKGLAQIYSKQGLMGLFSGVEWRVLKNGLHSSLYLYIYQLFIAKFSHTKIMEAQMKEQM